MGIVSPDTSQHEVSVRFEGYDLKSAQPVYSPRTGAPSIISNFVIVSDSLY